MGKTLRAAWNESLFGQDIGMPMFKVSEVRSFYLENKDHQQAEEEMFPLLQEAYKQQDYSGMQKILEFMFLEPINSEKVKMLIRLLNSRGRDFEWLFAEHKRRPCLRALRHAL